MTESNCPGPTIFAMAQSGKAAMCLIAAIPNALICQYCSVKYGISGRTYDLDDMSRPWLSLSYLRSSSPSITRDATGIQRFAVYVKARSFMNLAPDEMKTLFSVAAIVVSLVSLYFIRVNWVQVLLAARVRGHSVVEGNIA